MNEISERLQELEGLGLSRRLRQISGPQGPTVLLDGKPVLLLCSNNYLGLADHPRVREAAAEAAMRWGVGAGASRLVSGSMTIHRRLEERLAAFEHSEACLLFGSGYLANLGVIGALAGEGDVIFSDELNHASIVDGCRLSRAEVVVYRHRDIEHLDWCMRKHGERRAGRLIVTDSVFSMDGDIAPLPGICDVADRYEAAVMVDDAHASGVLGRNGRGTIDHFDLHGRVDIQVGTLSKAVGVMGGYIAGRQHMKDFLTQRCRPLLFSTSQPPAVAAACIAAIGVLENEPERIQRLWDNTALFKKGLKDLGFDTGISETPITPVMAGDEAKAQQLAARLFDEGIFATSVVFPTVALGKARVRTIVTSEHTHDDLQACLNAFEKVGRELRLI